MLSEHLEHALVVHWCRAQDFGKLLFAIPNGGYRNKKSVRGLKNEGVLAGTPDLMLPVASQGFHGLFIEMKSKNGKVSEAQKIVMEELAKNGYKCVVCYGHEHAKKEIISYIYDSA